MIGLVHIVAAGVRQTFSDDREVWLGRGEGCEVRLASPFVSRRHGRLTYTDDGWVFEDVGSTRGTMFRGRRIERLVLVGPVTLLLGEPGRGEEVRVEPENPSRIFICYRREDAAGHAGRLRDRLANAFGDSQVFLDIDQLAIGQDFVDRIATVIGSSRALLVVIGRRWLNSLDEQGHRRLDDPDDYVRIEIATALAKGPAITVIPVLVQGARMPRKEDLPAELAALSRRNALLAPDERWRREIDDLVERLEAIIRTEPTQSAGGGSRINDQPETH